MSVAGTEAFGGDPQRVAAQAPELPGRIVVQPRVLEKVAREAAASTIGVDRGSVSVDVVEGSRGVSLAIATPLPVPDLEDTEAIRSGEPVLARIAHLQEQLRDRIAPLIGRDIARVDITITGALIAQKRRVR